MDSSTLYYTFSAIPQVLAATSAVLAAFIHFRLSALQNILIGDGLAAIDRCGETGYFLDKSLADRLRDGVHRKTVAEIKEILELLKDREIEEGFTKADRPTGLRYLYEDRFCKAENTYKIIQTSSMTVIGFSLLTIIVSILSLSFVGNIICHNSEVVFLIINVGLFVTSIISSFVLVLHSFTQKTIYEDIKKRDEIIAKNRKSKV